MKKIRDYYQKYREVINYLIVGFFTTIVSLIIYYALVLTILNPSVASELQVANILSWCGGVIFAYFTNKKYVFVSNNSSKLEAMKFFLSRLGTLFMDMFLMYIMVSCLGFNDKIIKIIVQIVVIILNYILSKFIVFKGE